MTRSQRKPPAVRATRPIPPPPPPPDWINEGHPPPPPRPPPEPDTFTHGSMPLTVACVIITVLLVILGLVIAAQLAWELS